MRRVQAERFSIRLSSRALVARFFYVCQAQLLWSKGAEQYIT